MCNRCIHCGAKRATKFQNNVTIATSEFASDIEKQACKKGVCTAGVIMYVVIFLGPVAGTYAVCVRMSKEDIKRLHAR